MIFYYSYSVESVHEENDLRYVKPFFIRQWKEKPSYAVPQR